MKRKFAKIYNDVITEDHHADRNKGIGFCGCFDCKYNDGTGNCMVEEINLDYSKDKTGAVICECKTYVRKV